ncbi:bcl-2-modifying factor-like [Solea senegalensis]|uniref:Bcl-2-modifying factor-like n=2 Tax=Solea senegalensis TaxID=28829 RepID=A0AAV6RSW4_SOLSE|nr:bcl-2-modifying factor-like [Solea senegalensis]
MTTVPLTRLLEYTKIRHHNLVKIPPVTTESAFAGGSLPLRRRMDDEEEDMSQPISQLWGTSFGDIKYEDRASSIAAGQAFAAVTAAVPTSQSHNNNSIGINALPCSLHLQPRIPFHGSAGLRPHFPAHFEPMEDRGERQNEEDEEEEGRGEEDGRMAERVEEQAGMSIEVQIGRKLREIGDKFQQDHVELLMRHQRQNQPVWMRLTMALLGFLFPREALVPRLRGEQR